MTSYQSNAFTASKIWTEAIDARRSSLTPAQQALVRQHANAEDCITYIRGLQAKPKRLDKLLRVLSTITEPLKRFESVIDVAVSTNSGMASPIWAPLRLVVTIIHDYSDTLEKLLWVLEQIATSIGRYENYERLFETNQHVQESICRLYIDLLDLMVDLIKFYSKPMKRLFGTFDGSFGKMTRRIQFHSQEIDWAANAASQFQSKASWTIVEKRQEQTRLNQLLCWLCPCSVQDDIANLSKDLMPGSCDWLLSSAKVQKLLKNVVDDLTIIGSPGSGKSTAAAFLFNNLPTPLDKLVFFCDANNPEKSSALSIARTLVAQKLRVHPELNDKIYPSFQLSGRQTVDSWAELGPCLSVLEESVILVDAMNGCHDGPVLFEKLEAINIKIIQTTRPFRITEDNKSIRKSHRTTSLYIENPKVTEHVDKYISQQIGMLPSDLQHRLQVHIPKMCVAVSGSWLYARLLLDGIRRAHTDAIAVELAQDQPRKIDDLYANIIKSMFDQSTPEQLTMAAEIVSWIDESKYLPADLTSIGNGVLPETLSVVVAHANRGEFVSNPVDLAFNICVPLLRKRLIRIQKFNDCYESQELCFFHPTLGEYLQKSQDLFRRVQLRPPRIRAETATWYFSACDDSEERLKIYCRVLETTRDVSDCPIGPYLSMSYAIEGFMVFKDPDKSSEDVTFLTAFYNSPGAFRWLSMAIVLNYLGKWKKLQDNFQTIFESSKSRSTRRIASSFLAVLDLTAPWNDYTPLKTTETLKNLEHGHPFVKQLLVLAITTRKSVNGRSPGSKFPLSDKSETELGTLEFDKIVSVIGRFRASMSALQAKYEIAMKKERMLGRRQQVRLDY